jgi:hypothetical protein
MSGVAALLSLAEPPGVSSLATMLQAVPHRGTFSRTVNHGGAALGVVAHSPESPDACVDVADRYAAAVIGVIDNARELERDLRSRERCRRSSRPRGSPSSCIARTGTTPPTACAVCSLSS